MHFHAPSGGGRSALGAALTAVHARSLLCLLDTSSRLSRTLVPHASPASVRPLMRPSHAGRQIRETRLPAPASNWSPQQPDLSLPRAVIGGERREATSPSSVIAGILAWMLSRPSGFRRQPQRTIVCPPSAGRFQIPRECWTGAGGLEPCLTQEPNRTQNGDTPEMRRPTICFFRAMPAHSLCHVREAVVQHKASRPSLRNPRSQLLINPALPRVQTNKPQPCWPHVALASAWAGNSHDPCLTLLAGWSQVRTTCQPHTLHNLYWPKKSFFGRMLPPSPRAASRLVFC